MRDLPASLFRYFTSERVNGLAACEIAFPPRAAFNDPFEGRPEITGVSTLEQFKEVFERVTPTEFLRMYGKLPAEAKRHIPYETFEKRAREYLQTAVVLTLPQHMAHFDKFAQNFPDHLNKRVGVLCLCEERDSLLMWAHYARGHSGFVVEYHAAHPYFHAKRSENDEFFHLRDVKYREDRPSKTLTDLDSDDVFVTKSVEWEYEREWRVLKPLALADRMVQTEEGPIALFKYPPEIVASVILGARATQALKEEVRSILATTTGYHEVKLFQAAPDRSQFRLNFLPIEIRSATHDA